MFRACILAALCLPAAATPTVTPAPAGRISIDVRDLDIYDAVRLLATQAAVNVVVDSSVQHRPVTLRLQEVSFAKALSTLAQSNDLAAATVGDVIYLGSIDVIGRRYADHAETGIQTRVFPLRNAAPDDIAHALTTSLSRGTIIVADRRTTSVIVTGSTATIARADDLIDALDRSYGIQVATIPMKFVRAADALLALKNALPVAAPSSVYAGEQQNAIVVSGTADFISSVQHVLSEVDRPGRQVRYDVRVTDITPQADSSNIGVVFGGADITGTQHAGSGSTVTTFLNSSVAINATLDLLVTKGRASILAQPSLSTLNNVPAALLVGQSYPIVYFDPRTGTQQVQFVNVGVNLHVTPTIGSDGSITTDLETDYSQFLSFVNSFPVIGTRKAESTLRVHDGQTIVIAGLFSDIDSYTLTKVPFLSEIPLLGEIFKNRQTSRTKDEVVFLITPHLVTDAGASSSAQ